VASSPRVELLWWRECPSWERALEMLRVAVEDAGLDPDVIEVREVDTVESAMREEFAGSPTIRVDGLDVQSPVEGEPTGLACRVYRRRDGRTSPLPDPEDLRDALRAAAVR
jgi:hypothetical protein